MAPKKENSKAPKAPKPPTPPRQTRSRSCQPGAEPLIALDMYGPTRGPGRRNPTPVTQPVVTEDPKVSDSKIPSATPDHSPPSSPRVRHPPQQPVVNNTPGVTQPMAQTTPQIKLNPSTKRKAETDKVEGGVSHHDKLQRPNSKSPDDKAPNVGNSGATQPGVQATPQSKLNPSTKRKADTDKVEGRVAHHDKLQRPDSTSPGDKTPRVGNSGATQPVAAQPVATQPVPTQPVPTQPVPTQPVVTQPVVTQPVVTQPVVTQPVVTQPDVQSQPQVVLNPSTKRKADTEEIEGGEIHPRKLQKPGSESPKSKSPKNPQQDVPQPKVPQTGAPQPNVQNQPDAVLVLNPSTKRKADTEEIEGGEIHPRKLQKPGSESPKSKTPKSPQTKVPQPEDKTQPKVVLNPSTKRKAGTEEIEGGEIHPRKPQKPGSESPKSKPPKSPKKDVPQPVAEPSDPSSPPKSPPKSPPGSPPVRPLSPSSDKGPYPAKSNGLFSALVPLFEVAEHVSDEQAKLKYATIEACNNTYAQLRALIGTASGAVSSTTANSTGPADANPGNLDLAPYPANANGFLGTLVPLFELTENIRGLKQELHEEIVKRNPENSNWDQDSRYPILSPDYYDPFFDFGQFQDSGEFQDFGQFGDQDPDELLAQLQFLSDDELISGEEVPSDDELLSDDDQ